MRAMATLLRRASTALSRVAPGRYARQWCQHPGSSAAGMSATRDYTTCVGLAVQRGARPAYCSSQGRPWAPESRWRCQR